MEENNMVRSMTGYGHAKCTSNGICVTFEIKSVNHRFFEFSSRVPRNYGFLDEKLKSFLQDKISRGKIECFVQIEDYDQDNVVVSLNKSLINGYISAFNELNEQYGFKNDVTVSTVFSNSEIFAVHKEAVDEGNILDAVLTVAQVAVEGFIQMRESEGNKLKEDICRRISEIIGCVEYIEKRSPETVKEYNEKLIARIKELIGDSKIDEQRVLNEAAIFADKIAVAEETVRLRSHLLQLEELLNADEPIGRKMDFLVQEINREANTIGSKSQNIEITRCVVNIKSEIEKIREQVQNIE
jgi:uncharacterized protein (TIGR00255 family)